MCLFLFGCGQICWRKWFKRHHIIAQKSIVFHCNHPLIKYIAQHQQHSGSHEDCSADGTPCYAWLHPASFHLIPGGVEGGSSRALPPFDPSRLKGAPDGGQGRNNPRCTVLMSYYSCTLPGNGSRAARCQCQQPQTGQARCPSPAAQVFGDMQHIWEPSKANKAAPIPTRSPHRHKGSRQHNYLNSRTNQSYKRCW